jgi:DNA-binding beta-propeller fold protein YncE
MKKLSWVLLASVLSICLGCSRVPPVRNAPKNIVWPAPPETPRVRFIESFSSSRDFGIRVSWYKRLHGKLTGSEPAPPPIQSPYGIWADAGGRLLLADTSAALVHVFDREENVYRTLSDSSSGPLQSPVGVAVSADHRIFVSDSVLNDVFVFDENGENTGALGSEYFRRPTGLCVDDKLKRLYVTDTLAHQIKAFDLDGGFLWSSGIRGEEAGQFNFPTCICVDARHRIYVGDTLNFRVQVLDSDGNFLSDFGEAGDGTGYFSRIKGIAVDGLGHIYVTDAEFDVVQIFDLEGNFLMSFGGPGVQEGEFSFPAGIFIDAEYNIYVADRLNRRVQVFKFLREAE